MSLTIAETSTTDYTPPEAGTFTARLASLIDLGTQTSVWEGEEKRAHKVLLSFEITDAENRRSDGSPHTISKRFTASLHAKAGLRKFLESWRGRPFTPEELAGFDLKNVLGLSCFVGVVHETKGDKTYANLASVMKLPKGMPAGAGELNPVAFDLAAPDWQVIDAARKLQELAGQPVRLIVGDTLARLSAGANENSGQDMGLVVQRFDRIRRETGAHFLMIHHSGKAAAAGARGWSGIRAAVDTEIEVTDAPTGRCAEIMKQRDLSTKGDRIGFTLEAITLGQTKWGQAATSCVVVPSEAPDKPQGKRMGEVEGAVVEFLAARKVGVKKGDVVKHFDGRYDKANVYRAIRSLKTASAVWEVAGMVSIASPAT